MQIVKPRKHLRRALALLLVWLCGLLFAAHAHAEEPQPVTVDFVASTDYTKSSEDIVAAQNGYLYFNEKTTDGGLGRAGEWIEFPISDLAAGSYKVSIVYKTHTANGVFQTYIDGMEVGTPVNGQGSNAEHTVDLGTVTITESDVHTVKLMALQNDYGKYRITVKSLTLTPVESDEGSGEGSGSGSGENSGDGTEMPAPAGATEVTVDFTTSQKLNQSEGAVFSQSAGSYLYFNQGGENGAWVTFPLEGLVEGQKYKVTLVYKKHSSNGALRTYIDDTQVGDLIDLYANVNQENISTVLGTVTISEADSHSVKLEALTNSVGNSRITVKSLTLTPVTEEVPPTNINFGAKQISNSGNVTVWPKPYVYADSTIFTSITADDVSVPVVQYNDWYDYANFSMKGQSAGGGPVEVVITYKEPITTYDISPKKLGLTAEIVNGNQLKFTLTDDEYLIIQINGGRRLVLLADPWETDVPNSSGDGVFNVLEEPYSADRTGTLLATEAIQKAIDDASAWGTSQGDGARGVVYIPTGVYQISTLALKSNVELYLEGGAALRLTLDTSQYVKRGFKDSIGKPVVHMLYTYNNTYLDPYGFATDEEYETNYQNPANWVESTNIKIYGRGTIDGQGETVDGLGWLSETLVPQNCSYFTSDGIIYRESGVWSINVMASDHLEFTNLKVLNTFFHENDCIDICSSQDVVVRNAFGFALDDPFSTKAYQRGELFHSLCGDAEEVKNVLFEDCIAWTCCYGFKVGQGSIYTQDGVTFRDGVVYDCSVGIGIEHKYGDAELKNITFENIEIERVTMTNGAQSNWLSFQCVSGSKEGTQPISNVTVKDIKVYDTGKNSSKITGYDQDSLVSGIAFENIQIAGQEGKAASLSDMNITEDYLYANQITIDGVPMEDAPCPVTYLFADLVDSAEKSDDSQTPGVGDGYVYYGNAAGDWITFPIEVDEPGTYDLAVLLKHHPNKGIFQTYVNGVAIGEPVDQYGTNQAKTSVSLGRVTFNQAGTQYVKFVVIDKNSSSGSYQIVLNGVTLTLVEAHQHSFGSDWQADGTGHWQVCATCGAASQVEAHTAGDWIVDVPATKTEPGRQHKECTVCGYTLETAELPALGTSEQPAASPLPTETPAPSPSSTAKPTASSAASSQEDSSAGAESTAAQSSITPSVPQTGDGSMPGLWIVLMAASGLSAAGAALQKRKAAKR